MGEVRQLFGNDEKKVRILQVKGMMWRLHPNPYHRGMMYPLLAFEIANAEEFGLKKGEALGFFLHSHEADDVAGGLQLVSVAAQKVSAAFYMNDHERNSSVLYISGNDRMAIPWY